MFYMSNCPGIDHETPPREIGHKRAGESGRLGPNDIRDNRRRGGREGRTVRTQRADNEAAKWASAYNARPRKEKACGIVSRANDKHHTGIECRDNGRNKKQKGEARSSSFLLSIGPAGLAAGQLARITRLHR